MVQGCLQSPAPSVDALRDMCSNHSSGTTVTRVADGRPDWIVDGGLLRHSQTNYFSIGLYAGDQGEPLLLMEQTETALVMLLVAEVDGRDAVLLSLRTEPGLIGLTNLTATIQSTPSNYLRKHGGRGTPFIEIAGDPDAHGTVLHDGEQYDWGEYYHGKTKRFLVVRLDVPVDAPAGFRWVPMDTARALLLEDNLVTNDLRVLLTLVEARSSGEANGPHAVKTTGRGPRLRSIGFEPGVVDSRGISVSFFSTQTETREVRRWVQPLLVPINPISIRLPFVRTSAGTRFAVERRSQPGLLGHELWFPADVRDSRTGRDARIVRTVRTSAEGGRFWKQAIEISLVELAAEVEAEVDSAAPAENLPRVEARASWMSDDELSSLVAQPLQTSLELRMAWSLVHAASLHHA